MVVAFEKPLFVVALDESPDDLASLFQRFEVMEVQTLLFQRANQRSMMPLHSGSPT